MEMRGVIQALFLLSAMTAASAEPAVNIRAGKSIFSRTCDNCHSTKIGVNEIGPSLWNVVGRAPASVPDYTYSDAMKANSKPWTPAELDSYLANPRGHVIGARMWFKGLPSEKDRRNLIGYLKTLK